MARERVGRHRRRGAESDARWRRRPSVRGVAASDKRYITPAPVATVVGLAFHAHDGERDLGITCALIPVPHEGMEIGRRHRPMDSAFMNGPIRGRQVFVPMEWVIGGEAQVGQGWRMLMECLAAGRAISLPALGSAMQQSALYVANGYAQVRQQFGLPIGRFDAIAGVLGGMAAELYASDAARCFTAAALDRGERPSVASAMLKVQLAEAADILRDLHANLPTARRRWIGAMMLRRTTRLAPLRDLQLLALAETLRTEPEVVARLCPDLSEPAAGGLLELMQALQAAERLGSESRAALDKALRQGRGFEASRRRPPECSIRRWRWPGCARPIG